MKKLFRIFLPILIIAVALGGFSLLKKSAPEPVSRTPEEVVPKIQVIKSIAAVHAPAVSTFGTVQAYDETILTPQVSGRVEQVAEEFRVGSMVKEGDLLVTIDPVDFEAAIAVAQSNVAVARQQLQEERIRAEQAAEDWKASGRDISKASPFALREPQLAAAKASLESTEASVEQAQANLERTKILAPFDGVVTARTASVGQQASPQMSLGTIVSSDRAEVALPLTASQRARAKVPGAKVTLTSLTVPDVAWQGVITRSAPVIDQNQILTVFVEVIKPFEQTPLLLGTFVNAEIEAAELPPSHKLPQEVLVNDSYVWAVDEESRLQQLDATRLFETASEVYLQLKGDVQRIVDRPLSTFKTGDKVKVTEPEEAP